MPKSGPFQHRGQRQIVFGQQQKPAERDQVLHSQLLGQHQAVGSGDRDVALFERAQQFADELVAAPHQHHDVARPHRAAARLQHSRRCRATPRSSRRSRRRAGCEARSIRWRTTGSAVGIGRLLGLRDRRRPQLDQPRHGRRGPRRGGSRRRRARRRHEPHRCRKIASIARSTGSVERNEISSGTTRQSCRAALTRLSKCSRISQEGVRIGALKAVDRLFRVADGKDRAQAIAGALAGKELFGERGRRSPIARGWCPAPRRSGCGRARHRA